MISLRGVRKVYGDVVALDGVDLEIAQGTIHGIVGPSGAGKSTLVRCLTGLDRPTTGTIEVAGQNLSALGEAALRKARRRIGMVFQHVNLLDARTAAENTADGIIAPLLFLLLGGAPLAMAYKAVNTLDSMVGYKHEKYRAIGMVSARLDDVANFIPARLSWLLISLAALLCGEAGGRALRIGWRDRYNHSSPNCRWSEANVAGALRIRLGGPNDYFGQRVEKPWIGDATRDISVDDISRTIRLMWVSSTLALALFMAIRFWLVGAA